MKILSAFTVDKLSVGGKEMTISQSAGQHDIILVVLGKLTNGPTEPQAIMFQASLRYQRSFWEGGGNVETANAVRENL